MAILVSLSNRELRRLEIVNRLLKGQINGTQAAEAAGLSVRQIRRLKSRVRVAGAKAIAHASRGQTSNFKISSDEQSIIVSLLHEHYSDFGPTFAAEKLFERHHIVRDPKTIRTIMIKEALWTPRRKKGGNTKPHRAWRIRRANYGELIQFDGSYEHWFEDRDGTSEVCLLAAIDDATSQIVSAWFDQHEGVFPVFGFWHKYLTNIGKPLSIYLDKFSTYKMSQKAAIENHDLKTQFQRAMTELRIEPIFANSPQAKGRVERLFRTLQDRLIKELRLNNISDIETANKFLKEKFIPAFNRRFAVPPRNPANLHQQLSDKEKNNLIRVLSRQTPRVVQNDFTISFNTHWFQLLPQQPVTVCKRDQIMVEERIDGSIHFRLRNKYFNAKPILKRAEYSDRKRQPWVLAAGQTD
ncbi:MAG: hypothetical protein A2261_03165 [Candidatus Magasanikbacteria bacterium RIFOXYA2_FULL_44_8]|uniref:Integrase catalytic domain-containing protein n=1 Tax=Candidatus Magasanikbacteria bacterium RIFOXYA2_FULL_44_8 TaxID=1798696 RepID=A0A1F6NL25_9BACT|nr:MAG: hypothetical protein A2261_03165 [Candidatus Magasanikbacteria bacterium RIFOXYA2_FULL_44_8]